MDPMAPPLSSPYYLVRITDVSAAPAYGFQEVWLTAANTPVFKAGGRYGNPATNPGYHVSGGTFAVGDLAHCRSADGNGGLTWELSPVGAGGGAAGVTSLSTTNATGGPLTGAVTLTGGSGVSLAVAANDVTINVVGSGGLACAVGSGITSGGVAGLVTASATYAQIGALLFYRLTFTGANLAADGSWADGTLTLSGGPVPGAGANWALLMQATSLSAGGGKPAVIGYGSGLSNVVVPTPFTYNGLNLTHRIDLFGWAGV